MNYEYSNLDLIALINTLRPKGSSLEFPAETVTSPMDGLTHKLIKVISGEVEQKAQCLLPLSVSRVSIEKWVAKVAPLWVALNGCR